MANLRTKLYAHVARKLDVWKTPYGDVYADIKKKTGKGTEIETYSVSSEAFRHWVVEEYYRMTEFTDIPSEDTIRPVLKKIEASSFQGPEHSPAIRVKKQDETIWIDMRDPESRYIQLTRNGWSLTPT